jgi:hypothetical protein
MNMNWTKASLKIWVVVFLVSGALWLTIDFLVGQRLLDAFSISAQVDKIEKKYRIEDSVIHHTLAPSFDGRGRWGGYDYRVCTNAYGFKSPCGQSSSESYSKHYDIAFIGDSFTEGIGLPYEETFVGLIAKAEPNLMIANLGVSSYAPSIYLAKLKKLLDEGFCFREVVAYIDIGDIQDEAISYRHGVRVVDDLVPGMGGSLNYLEKTKASNAIKATARQLLPLTSFGWHLIKVFLENPSDVGVGHLDPQYQRGSWTYNDKSEGYGDIGVNGAVDKAIDKMSMLYQILAMRGIKLSIAVYPWPQQILYDQQESRQVKIWKKFCETRCAHFYNSFPSFFAIAERLGKYEAIDSLYIHGDVHHSAAGAKLIADDYLAGRYN